MFPQDRIDRMKAGGDPDKLEGNTDWYDELLRSGAPQHNHQLTVSGGSDKITYMISAGYSDQQGIIPSSRLWNVTIFVLIPPPNLLLG